MIAFRRFYCEVHGYVTDTYLMQMIVPAVLKAALHIFLTAIERVLRQYSPDASAASRLGAVVFIPLWRATQHASVRPLHRGGRRFDADMGRTAKCSNRPHDKDKVDVCNGSNPDRQSFENQPFGSGFPSMVGQQPEK
jgi:hypothetical protein